MTLVVGNRAPDFTLPCSSGGTVTLSEVLRSRRAVVLFFYPRDHTVGCTAEACGFRDAYEGFAEAGADVLGISADSGESHRRFSDEHKLPMRLLTDEDGAVRRSYGVRPTLGIIPGRATFVVDARGVVRHVYSSLVRVASHVEQALVVVRQLASGAA